MTESGEARITETCSVVNKMSNCFTALLVIMVLQFIFNVHTLVTMYLIVKKRVAS